MPTKTLLFVVLVLLGVGLFNQTAYRVLETEKAILLEFGNLVDASSAARTALQTASGRRSEEVRCASIDIRF